MWRVANGLDNAALLQHLPCTVICCIFSPNFGCFWKYTTVIFQFFHCKPISNSSTFFFHKKFQSQSIAVWSLSNLKVESLRKENDCNSSLTSFRSFSWPVTNKDGASGIVNYGLVGVLKVEDKQGCRWLKFWLAFFFTQFVRIFLAFMYSTQKCFLHLCIRPKNASCI